VSTRRTARGLGVLALLVPLSGAGLLLSATPAFAASGSITSPGDGAPFEQHANISIAATMDKNSGSGSLRVTSPNGGTDTVDTASTTLTAGASMSYAFETGNCPLDQACGGNAIAPNGTWKVTLVGGSSTLDTTSFILRIPPRAPGNVSAHADGYRAAVVSWSKGGEPDLTGWTLYADGGPVQEVGTDACSGTSCTSTVTYAEDGTGDHTYSLVAHRRAAPGSDEVLDSGQSAQASATLAAPPPPSPAAADPGSDSTGGSTGDTTTGGSTTGGSSTTSGGGSSTGGTSTGGSGGSGTSTGGTTGTSTAIGSGKAPATLAQRRAFALTFKAFAPKLGIPKLPPLPAAQGPSVAPLPDGTYEQTLGYKDVLKTEKVDSPKTAARRVTHVVGSALDSGQFMRFMAAALIFLLLAAHARRWLASHHED
jgi:hypothetical protein